jgi:nucleotide-binding universal stress UspA family protein
MGTINKILVATDGSASSNRAVDMAASLATIHGASLFAINVIRQIQIPPEMQNMAVVESLGETRLGVLEHIANQILDQAEQRVKDAGAKLEKKSIGHEDPATSISEFSKKHNIDLLIIGTRGLSKVKALMMGSVSRKITEICDVNCLIVR